MLLPHELEFLRKEEGRSRLHWVVVAAIAVVCALVPITIALASGGADHLGGRTDSAMATVESVQEIGNCRSGDDHRVTLSWTEDGVTKTGTYDKCGDTPQAGETLQIWIDSDGEIHTESPETSRIGLIGLTVSLGALAGGTGAIMVIRRARQRRLLLAAGRFPLTPAGQVEVRAGQNGTVGIRSVASARGRPVASSGAWVALYTSPGSSTKRHPRKSMSGRWWLQLAPPIPAAKRPIGLLVRGPERCWVELRGR